MTRGLLDWQPEGSPEIGEFGTVSSCRADVTIGMHFEQLSEP